jgi:phage-related protein
MVEKLSVEVGLEGGDQLQRDLSQLEQSFVNLGNSIRDFATTFAELGATAGVIAIAAATTAMIKFTNAAEQTTKQLTELQKVSGATFDNLSALQQVFAAGGTTLNKFASELSNVSEKIAAATQAKQIREADRDWVQWANDIDRVRGQFDNLAAGGRVAFSALTTLQTKVQGLLESLGKVRDPQEQWLRLAEVFKNLSSDIERAQLGKALGLSPETIATLSQGAAGIKQLQAEMERLGLTLTTTDQAALQQATAGWNQFTALVTAAFQKIGAAAAPALSQLLQTAKQTLAEIVSDFQTLPLDKAIASLGERLQPAFSAILDVLSPILIQIGNTLGVGLVQGIGTGISNALNTIWSNLGSEFEQNLGILWENLTRLGAAEAAGIRIAANFVNGIIQGILSAAGQIWEAIKSALGFAGGGEVGGGDTGLPFASGGMVGGRGTGTSDSNLAWVSRGEHIMPARAVAQPGVLAFLEALRHSGGNLSRVLDRMSHFALGGQVPRMMPIPAFAAGGMVGARRVLNLNIEGRSFAGLSVPESTAQALERFAVHSQIASTGRKPSWRK